MAFCTAAVTLSCSFPLLIGTIVDPLKTHRKKDPFRGCMPVSECSPQLLAQRQRSKDVLESLNMRMALPCMQPKEITLHVHIALPCMQPKAITLHVYDLAMH